MPSPVPLDPDATAVVTAFHRQYYHRVVMVRWFGWSMMKCPLDLWQYQEIITRAQPDLIVESGTAYGGSALYLASLCDLIGNGQVLTIDLVRQPKLPDHDRITYLTGSSTDPAIVAEVQKRAAEAERVMVVLDSDHSATHVGKELELYGPLVTEDQYLIVEDTNLGHEVRQDYGPGPREAIAGWLPKQAGFVVDRNQERFMLTYNPQGYLKRIA